MAENKDKVLKALEKYLKAIRAWPEDGQNFSLIFSIKAAIPVVTLLAPLELGVLGCIYKSLSEGNLADFIVGSIFLASFNMFVISSGLYYYKGNELLRIQEKFSIQKYGIPKNFEITNERIDRITRVLYYYTFLLCFCSLPFWCFWDTDCLTKKNSNGQIMQGYMRGLVSPAWFPFNVNIFPRKQIIFICNLLLWFRFAPNMNSGIILIYAFTKLIVNRIEHLLDMMKDINFKDINRELTRAKLRICMKYYSEIALLSRDANEIVGTIYAPSQNGLIVVMIGLLEYEITLEKNAVALVIIIFFMIAQASVCYSGQNLEDASERLRQHVYDLSWYDMDSTIRTDFKLFHAFVQKNLHVKIKPNINVNMVHLYTVMKAAYSLMMYFTRF